MMVNVTDSYLSPGPDVDGPNEIAIESTGPANTTTQQWDTLAPYDLSDLDPSLFLNDFEHDMFLDVSPFAIILIVLYSIVFIVGLVGNVLVIVVIIKFKSMRTLTNVFLVNLTVGDLLVIFLCVPVTLGNTVYKKWVYGAILCKLAPFIQGSAVGVSVFSLLSISISRYFAIYKPLTAKIVFSKRNVHFMLAGIWMLSSAAFSPLLVLNTVKTYGIPGIFEGAVCKENWPTLKDKNIYNVFIFCMLFVWPFSLMAIAYTVIGHTLWNGNAVLYCKETQLHFKKSNVILRQRRRTVKMLVCVICMFGVCWLPYYIVQLWIDFNVKQLSDAGNQSEAGSSNDFASDSATGSGQNVTMEIVTQYVYPLVILLGLANSLVNPICYYFLSNGFRRGFRKIFCSRIVRHRGSILSSLKIRTSASESIETADF